MTVTIAWWWLPILFIVLGVLGAVLFGKRQGDYDMVSPLIGAACVLLGIVAALAFFIGRWLA